MGKVPEDVKEDILKVMWSISDNRVVALANELKDVMHDAANVSLDRDSFKALVIHRLGPQMAQLNELKSELFPERTGEETGIDGKSHFQALFKAMEHTNMMEAFDKWKAEESEKAAKEEKTLIRLRNKEENKLIMEENRIIKDTEEQAKKEVEDVIKSERDAAEKDVEKAEAEKLEAAEARFLQISSPNRRLASDLAAGGVQVQLKEFMTEIKSK